MQLLLLNQPGTGGQGPVEPTAGAVVLMPVGRHISYPEFKKLQAEIAAEKREIKRLEQKAVSDKVQKERSKKLQIARARLIELERIQQEIEDDDNEVMMALGYL